MSVDLPLEELLKYQGTNPKPADYDKYWQKALDELDVTSPSVRFTLSEWQVPNFVCQDMWFHGVRGGKIYAKYVRPANYTGKLPAILHFHGYTCASEQWAYIFGLASLGFAVFYMDCRGQGGASYDNNGYRGRTHFGMLMRGVAEGDPQRLAVRHIMLDTAQLARIVMSLPEIDPTRVTTYGQSQGGSLAVACAGLEPRVNYCVTVFPYLSDYKRVYQLALPNGTNEEVNYWFRSFDPMHEREDWLFEFLGYVDIQFFAPRIKAKVLMMTALSDQCCPPSSQFAMYNKLTTPKELRVFPDFTHEPLPNQTDIMLQWLLPLVLPQA